MSLNCYVCFVISSFNSITIFYSFYVFFFEYKVVKRKQNCPQLYFLKLFSQISAFVKIIKKTGLILKSTKSKMSKKIHEKRLLCYQCVQSDFRLIVLLGVDI